MSYTLLDVAISPMDILGDSLSLIIGIAVGLGIIFGITAYFIRKNKNKEDEAEKEE